MNNNQNSSDSNTQNVVPVQVPASTTWVTVNTSTSSNVTNMEISKSDDYDRIVKTK